MIDHCCSPVSLVPMGQLPAERSDISTRSCSTAVAASEASTSSAALGRPLLPDSLVCEEQLLDNDECMQQHTQSGRARTACSPDHSTTTTQEDVQHFVDMARNEHARSGESRPSPSYLDRQAINEMHRAVSVNWLIEACSACNFHDATLFQAVTAFDRFCSVAKEVSPGMLQLVATASLAVAAKMEEVLQPTMDEWVAIADSSFSAEDLTYMEYLLLHYLGWRVRSPTAYSFTHLFALALRVDAAVSKAAVRMTELTLLDYSMLSFTYSTIAAAGLVASHHVLGLGFDLPQLLAIAPYLSQADVGACVAALERLHAQYLQRCQKQSMNPPCQESLQLGDCRESLLERRLEQRHTFEAGGLAAAAQ